MNTISRTSRKTKTELDHEVSSFFFKVICSSAIILGIWGAVCLISALWSNGIAGLARSYFTALTGI